MSDLNYKIVDKKMKEFVVHISRLKSRTMKPPEISKAHVVLDSLDRRLDN